TRAVPALAKRVADELGDEWEKEATLNALRALDLEAVTPALLRALEANNRTVRLWATRKLGDQKGDKAVTEPLRQTLFRKDGEQRRRAAESLGRLGDRSALADLARRVADADYDDGEEKNAALG